LANMELQDNNLLQGGHEMLLLEKVLLLETNDSSTRFFQCFCFEQSRLQILKEKLNISAFACKN